MHVGRIVRRSDGKIHYQVNGEPKHRIDVKWLFDKKPKRADFSNWQDTVHQVLKEDLPKIKDKELRTFLKHKLSEPRHQIIRKPLSRTAIVKKYGHREESSKHKALKEWIANNPDFIGLSDVNKAIIEYEFPSGDRADVVFERTDNHYTVVEIETDIPLPGAYQALKYRTLRCAELGLPIDSSDVEAILVAWSLSPELKAFCKKYNIRCVEKKL